MKFLSFKNWLVEKFTEDDSDPIKTMGIGSKVVYYEFKPYITFSSNPDPEERHYELILTGNTFNIKDLIKKHGFRWSDLNKGWRSSGANRLKTWRQRAPELFKEIEKNPGYVVEKRKNIQNTDSPEIEGWGISEYPNVADGTGLKVYVKVSGQEPFAVVLLMGKGTYESRDFLKYFKFRFDKEKHGWIKSYNKTEIDEIIRYLKEHNYEIIDLRQSEK